MQKQRLEVSDGAFLLLVLGELETCRGTYGHSCRAMVGLGRGE